jgi:hypothetical protein
MKKTTKKKSTAKKKSAKRTKKKKTTTQPIAQVQRVQITSTGRLLVTLRCPSYRPRACGASGTVVAGTSLGEVIPDTTLTFTIPKATVPKGKTIVRSFELTTAQLDELRTLTDVNFQVRLSTPAAPARVNEVFVHATVPAELLAPPASG